ncbi:MAG: LapA family protein [Gammaproteobacteria bacterium]|nr:LapA family protein [Gammaproteobacteria bacterium]
MRFLKLLFLLLVMMIGAAFAVMNADVVTLNYYFGSRVLPLSVVLVGAVAVGSLIGVVAIMFRVIGLKRENAELRRKAHLASQEVKNLRAIPLQDH